MRIYGIDFTSTPTSRKPITCLVADLDDNLLSTRQLLRWHSLSEFEDFLSSPGPWVAGFDFPFGQARRFIETIGWLPDWQQYVGYVASLSRAEFRQQLDTYRQARASGDKEHRRYCDQKAGAISPQKLYGVPVGLMFFEGATRILNSQVSIPGLRPTVDHRSAFETYPALVARRYIGRRTYKQDSKDKQNQTQADARHALWQIIHSPQLEADFGLRLENQLSLCNDPSGDELDALLCAIQAGWAYLHNIETIYSNMGIDPLEGWIADPSLIDQTLS